MKRNLRIVFLSFALLGCDGPPAPAPPRPAPKPPEATIYICLAHPDEVSESPGACKACGTALQAVRSAGGMQVRKVVPETAVVTRRSLENVVEFEVRVDATGRGLSSRFTEGVAVSLRPGFVARLRSEADGSGHDIKISEVGGKVAATPMVRIIRLEFVEPDFSLPPGSRHPATLRWYIAGEGSAGPPNDDPPKILAVPIRSMIWGDAEAALIRVRGDDSYESVPVEMLGWTSEYVAIKTGILKEGDRVLANPWSMRR